MPARPPNEGNAGTTQLASSPRTAAHAEGATTPACRALWSWYRRQSDWIFVIVAAAVVCVTAFALWQTWPFTTDDAYITLRYAQNWSTYGRLDWNLDNAAPVEGYTNTLYLLLATGAMKLGYCPVLILKSLGLVALCAAALILFRLVATSANRWAALLAVILFAGYPGTIWWSVSGLETPTYVFLVLACLALFDRCERSTVLRHKRTLLCLLSLLVFLCALTRPEGPVIGIVLGGLMVAKSLFLKRTGIRILADTLCLALPFVLLYALFFVIRYDYYGRLWPNTFYCKTNQVAQPWTIAWQFIVCAQYALVVGLVAFLNPRRRPLLTLCYCFIVANTLLYYGVQPSIAHLNRHALASLALAYAVCAVGLHELFARWHTLGVTLGLGVVLWAMGYGVLINTPTLHANAAHYATRMEARAKLAHYLQSLPIKNYAIGDAGLVPYLTPDLFVYDYYGLNSTEFIAPEINRSGVAYAKWLLHQRPHAVVVVGDHPSFLPIWNETQAALLAHFTPANGYEDAGIVIGAKHDVFRYRVLLNREIEPAAYPNADVIRKQK